MIEILMKLILMVSPLVECWSKITIVDVVCLKHVVSAEMILLLMERSSKKTKSFLINRVIGSSVESE